MQTTEPRALAPLHKGKSCAAHREDRPGLYRERAAGRWADRRPEEPPLRYEVESLQHWLDLNA